MKCEDPEGDFVLLNKCKTLVRFSQRARVDITELMARMEELNVPFGYTEDVKEIYFTVLSGMHGDYSDGNLRLHCGHESKKIHDRTLIHELAHHVDEVEGISDREGILKEKMKKARYLPDTYARKNLLEYIAVGFEVYYCGTRDEKRKMKRCNPILFNTIRYLHRKYKAR